MSTKSRQSHIGDQTPRFEFAGVRRFALVVIGEALFQVVSQPDVVLLPLMHALDEINVDHAGSVSEKPSFAKPTDGSLRLDIR